MAKRKAGTTTKRTEGKVNKSELVRAYMAAHPDAKPSAIVAALTSHGVKTGLVNSVRVKEKKKSGVAKADGRVAHTDAKVELRKSRRIEANGDEFALLQGASTFIKQVGGLDKAIAVLGMLRDATRPF